MVTEVDSSGRGEEEVPTNEVPATDIPATAVPATEVPQTYPSEDELMSKSGVVCRVLSPPSLSNHIHLEVLCNLKLQSLLEVNNLFKAEYACCMIC